MVHTDLLIEQFKQYSVDINADILLKCSQLCEKYNQEADEFVEEWVAFSASNSLELSPNLDVLDLFEKKVFCKTSKSAKKAKKLETPKNLTKQINNETIEEFSLNDSEILIPSTPSALTSSQLNAPANFKYTILQSFGKPIVKQNHPSERINVRIQHSPKYRFMDDKLEIRHDIVCNHIKKIINELLKKYNIGKDIEMPDPIVDAKFQGTKTICGIVVSKNTISEVNGIPIVSKNFYLRGIDDNQTVAEDTIIKCEGIPQYSIFSGQVIVATAQSIRTNYVKLTNIYTDLKPSNTRSFPNIRHPLNIFACCGPYTDPDDLNFRPLQSLIKIIKDQNPQVVVMMGPFIDCNNKGILEYSACSFDDLFEKIVNILMKSLQSLSTHVILIPSVDDVNHYKIFPTPPFENKYNFSNLHMAPDPALININGLIMLATSNDCISKLCNEMITNSKSNRIEQIFSYLFAQKCCAPFLNSYDSKLWSKLTMLESIPHLFITPSKLELFAMNVKNCLVANCGHWSERKTFAQFRIDVPKSGSTFLAGVSCEVVNVDSDTS